MKSIDFVVPIFSENYNLDGNNDLLIGTGFFCNNYLITASHVLHKSQCSIMKAKYGRNIIELSDTNKLYDEYDKQGSDGIYRDLLIYKIDSINSPFKLYDKKVCKDVVYGTFGYSYDSASRDKLGFNGCCNCIRIMEEHEIALFNYSYFENCTYIKNDLGYSFGNSGCPIYIDDIVYGMLVSCKSIHNHISYRMIDSNYISFIIGNISRN